MKFRVAILSCVLAVAAFASDLTGKWTAEVEGRDGNKREITFNLKADGDKLTGSVGSPMGETDIQNGKINGDDLSFDVVREFNGNTVKMSYTGKVSGDQIQFKQQREGGNRTVEFTAKRSAT